MSATPRAESKRVQGNQVAAAGSVRLQPGGPVELLNVSEKGALVESRQKLATGTKVVLITAGDRPQRLQGEVVRSTVTAIHRDSTMTYQLAIAFGPDVKFDGLHEEPAPPVEAPPPVDSPAPPVAAVAAALANEW